MHAANYVGSLLKHVMTINCTRYQCPCSRLDLQQLACNVYGFIYLIIIIIIVVVIIRLLTQPGYVPTVLLVCLYHKPLFIIILNCLTLCIIMYCHAHMYIGSNIKHMYSSSIYNPAISWDMHTHYSHAKSISSHVVIAFIENNTKFHVHMI